MEVSFPKVPGIPPGFDEIQKIVEDILPAHLLVQYHFWYLTWAQLESKFSCWREIETKAPHLDRAGDLCGAGGRRRIRYRRGPAFHCAVPPPSVILSHQLLQRLDHLKDQSVTVLLPGDARLLGPGEQRGALRGLVLLPEAAEQLAGLLGAVPLQPQQHQGAGKHTAGGSMIHAGAKHGPS